MAETDTLVPHDPVDVPEVDYSTKVLAGAATVGILVNLNALIIPILGIIGGGVLAGFIAAYAAGGTYRGVAHGLIAGALTGFAGGLVVVLTGSLIGLYSEPPSLLLNFVGPVSPWYDHMGGAGNLLIVTTITILITVDALLGSLFGSGARRAVDQVIDR
ncbi:MULTISPECIES: hypothetical protein [unclassified Haladaptatus]|uniref:hypothetical protein n=1 Tax=unclassified Haladaptatus TaxID=2622732 RepID=UPI0023E8FB34|nr:MULTISPECIES: hypothetical protein [unclassified Haladaptatus]